MVVVLHAVAGEDAGSAVVHLDREVDGQLALRVLQDFVEAGVQAEVLCGYLKLSEGVVVGVAALPRRCGAAWSFDGSGQAHRFLLESVSIYVIRREGAGG